MDVQEGDFVPWASIKFHAWRLFTPQCPRSAALFQPRLLRFRSRDGTAAGTSPSQGGLPAAEPSAKLNRLLPSSHGAHGFINRTNDPIRPTG